MSDSSHYRLGSIWGINFDPSVGTEIRKTRPGLIISGTLFNQKRRKVSVLPFTSARSNDSRISPAVVSVSATPTNGLSVDSLVVCIEPMTFDKKRLSRYLGQLDTNLLGACHFLERKFRLLAFSTQG